MDLLGEMGQESAIKKGNKNVSKNVLFQKEVQLYFDHSTRRSGGGGAKETNNTVTFNK